MLRIELDNEHSTFRPGEVLAGRIHWELNQAPQQIAAWLSWSTEGKGDEDSASVVQQSWAPQAAAGTQTFRWQLPRGPLSLDGTLIRIRWSIECSSENPDEEVAVPIVLSHIERAIALNSTENARL